MAVDWLTDEDVPMVALSPHLDDLLFSACSVVQRRSLEAWTVFAGFPERPATTAWDESCGFPDSTATLTARRAEDEAAFAGSRATVRHLPLLDGPYTDPDRRRADLATLRGLLLEWIETHPGGVVLAPAGAGARVEPAIWERLRGRTPASDRAVEVKSPATETPADGAARTDMRRAGIRGWGVRTVRAVMHADYQRRRAAARRRGLAVNTDHLTVRDLVLGLVDRTTVVLYEDLPYLWAEPADAAVAEISARRNLTATPVEVTVDTADKFNRIGHYTSQLDVMDPVERRLSHPGRLPATERFWVLERKDR